MKENTGDGEQWSLGGTLEYFSFLSLKWREEGEKEPEKKWLVYKEKKQQNVES